MIINMERRSKSCKEFETSERRDKPMKVSEALLRVLSKAVCEHRLVSGMSETASVLQRVPSSSVLFCVLENKKVEDIQMRLMEAFCTEHKIKLIKVVSLPKPCRCDEILNAGCASKHSLPKNKENETNTSEDTPRADNTCMLVTQPEKMSPEEEFVLAFYETFKYCKNAYPVVRLQNNSSVES